MLNLAASNINITTQRHSYDPVISSNHLPG